MSNDRNHVTRLQRVVRELVQRLCEAHPENNQGRDTARELYPFLFEQVDAVLSTPLPPKPSPPRWTSVPPVVPGFYYWRGGALLRYPGIAVSVVQVTRRRDGSRWAQEMIACASRLYFFPPGDHPTHPSPESIGGRWFGPLPQPQE